MSARSSIHNLLWELFFSSKFGFGQRYPRMSIPHPSLPSSPSTLSSLALCRFSFSLFLLLSIAILLASAFFALNLLLLSFSFQSRFFLSSSLFLTGLSKETRFNSAGLVHVEVPVMQFQVGPKLHVRPTCLSVVVEPPTILVVPLSDPSSWAFQVRFTEFSRASSSQKTQTHKNSQKPRLTKLSNPNLQTLTYRDLLSNQLVGFQRRCHSLTKIQWKLVKETGRGKAPYLDPLSSWQKGQRIQNVWGWKGIMKKEIIFQHDWYNT